MSTPFKSEWLQPGAVVSVDIPTLAAFAAELRRLHQEVQEQCRLNGMGAERELKLMAELEQARRANAELLEALNEAATSLETISRLAGKATYLGDDGERIPTFMGHNDEVRGYSSSRASVARAAIAKHGSNT